MKLLLSLSFIIIASAANASVFTVIKLKGIIYYNDILLKEGDNIEGLTKLRSDEVDAALRLSNAQYGTFVVSFKSGHKSISLNRTSRSEFYELVIDDFLKTFSPDQGSLRTRSGEDFDWFSFFYDVSENTTAKKVLLFSGEKLYMKSKVFPTTTPYRFLVCKFPSLNDSVLTELAMIDDTIQFTEEVSSKVAGRVKIKIGYQDNGRAKILTVTDHAIELTLLNDAQFAELANFFFSSWKKDYDSAERAEDSFYTFLVQSYGQFDISTVGPKLKKYLR